MSLFFLKYSDCLSLSLDIIQCNLNPWMIWSLLLFCLFCIQVSIPSSVHTQQMVSWESLCLEMIPCSTFLLNVALVLFKKRSTKYEITSHCRGSWFMSVHFLFLPFIDILYIFYTKIIFQLHALQILSENVEAFFKTFSLYSIFW